VGDRVNQLRHQFSESCPNSINTPNLIAKEPYLNVQLNGPLHHHVVQIHHEELILNQSQVCLDPNTTNLDGRQSQINIFHDGENHDHGHLQTAFSTANVCRLPPISEKLCPDKSAEYILNLVKIPSMADKPKPFFSKVLENLLNDESNSSDSPKATLGKKEHCFKLPKLQGPSSLIEI
jgi:hypothetical protein